MTAAVSITEGVAGIGADRGGRARCNTGGSLTGELSFPENDPVLEARRIECDVPVLMMEGVVIVRVRDSFDVTRS